MAGRTCLYEILEVERTANDAEIKAAYRRLALIHHPDKNTGGDKDAAEERFRELKDAYDTLKDPHERAWYDTHRADLLRGAAPGSGGGAASSPVPNLDPYLSMSCFEGFGPDKEGFYATYARIFDQLARLERDADPDDSYESDGHSDDPDRPARQRHPGFGDERSSHEAVKRFFRRWMSFSTRLSFTWAFHWDTRDAESRYIRRVMERENARAARKQAKAHTAKVIKLVEHVSRLDPRFAAAKQADAAARDARMRAERDRVEAERRARNEAAAAWKEAEWADTTDEVERMIEEQIERELARDGGGVNASSASASSFGADNDAGEAPEEAWFCEICSKGFKSERQWENHERSKKHRALVAEARQALAIDGFDDDILFGAGAAPDAAGPAVPPVDIGTKKGKKKKKNNRQQQQQQQPSDDMSPDAVMTKQEPIEENVVAKPTQEDQPADGNDPASVPLETEQKKPEPEVVFVPKPKRGAAALKREKRAKAKAEAAAAAGAAPKQKVSISDSDSDGDQPKPHACTICSARFTSKTKLFTHIRTEGHAALKTVAGNESLSKGGKKGKRK